MVPKYLTALQGKTSGSPKRAAETGLVPSQVKRRALRGSAAPRAELPYSRLRSASVSSGEDIADGSYVGSERSASGDASEVDGMVQATKEWLAAYCNHLKWTQDPEKAPSKKTIAAFQCGIPWGDLFPKDRPKDWPSEASLRHVLAHQLRYKPDVFPGLSKDEVETLDQQQALEHLKKLRDTPDLHGVQPSDRLKIGFDEICELPSRCTKAFLVGCTTSETERIALAHFVDFIKETLNAGTPDAIYEKKTRLSATAPPVYSKNRVTHPPRYLEHHRIFTQLRKDPNEVTRDDPVRIFVFHLFESAVSPFDPAPIATMLEDAKPSGWPDRGTPELWAAKLYEAMEKRYFDLDGPSNERKLTMVKQIAYKAVEIETGAKLPSLIGGAIPKPFQCMAIRDLSAVLDSKSPKSVTHRGRRSMLHLLEEIHPEPLNPLHDLLDAARCEEEEEGTPNRTVGEKKAFRKKWLDRAVQSWVKAIPPEKMAVDGRQKEDVRQIPNWITVVSKVAIEEWWPDEELDSVPASRLTARTSKLDSPNGQINGWIAQVLKRRDVNPNDEEYLKKMLSPLSPDTEEGARSIVEVIQRALPAEPRPEDWIHGQVWAHRAHHAARDALFEAAKAKSKLEVFARRSMLDRFASAAVSELSGVELSLAAEHTGNAHMLGWLHRFQTHATNTEKLTDAEVLTVMEVARDIETRTQDHEHFFLDTLRSSRPCGQRPVDHDKGEAWDAAWCRDAIAGIEPYIETSKPHRKLALGRLVRFVIDEWAAVEKIPLAERDKMVPYRDADRPGERVYGWLAGPDGQLHPGVELDRLGFQFSQKDYFSGWLVANAHLDGNEMSARKADQLIESMRRDTKDLLEGLFGFKEGELPVRGVGLPLQADDLPRQEKPMAEGGHWGFFIEQPERLEDAFTAENGRIAGIYIGIPFGVDEKGDPLLPPGEHANRAISGAEKGANTQGIAGTAFSGSTSMANVSLLPDPEDPTRPLAAYDFARTNSVWMPMYQTFIDPHQQKRTLPVLALVVSNRVFSGPGRSSAESETGSKYYEARVNCGPDFLKEIAAELGIAPPTDEALAAAEDPNLDVDFDVEDNQSDGSYVE